MADPRPGESLVLPTHPLVLPSVGWWLFVQCSHTALVHGSEQRSALAVHSPITAHFGARGLRIAPAREWFTTATGYDPCSRPHSRRLAGVEENQ